MPVKKQITEPDGDFFDGPNGTNTDYNYDVNGNLNTDNNKNISSITYNHLNLPSVITVTGKGTISYTYDAAGNKLQKTVTETGQPTKTTTYIGGIVYENDALQFIGMEEGRIRITTNAQQQPNGYAYDYMLKDHLGNVRMVLTEEHKQDKYPVASLEDAKVNTEDDYYTIQTANIVAANTVTGLPTYTNDNGIGNNPPDPTFENSNSQKLYKLNSNTNKTGLGITLKVMAGDRIDILGKSYYFQNNTGGSGANSALPILELLNGLMGTPGGATGGSHTTATELNGISGVTSPISNNFINNPGRDNGSYPQRPKAFINYLFLDEQFKFVDGGFSAVNNTPGLKDHLSELQNRVAQKNGYVYIYVSNESPVDVFFDNLQVVHTRSPILEETHYYPFGLTMSGVSSEALEFGNPKNKYKYNGIETENAFQIGIYDAQLRELDGQTGRWWQIDPKIENMEVWSTYVLNYNNPILYSDPLGDEPESADGCCGGLLNFVEDVLISASGVLNGTLNTVSFGIISSDPFGFRDKLSDEKKELYDNSVNVGKVGPLFVPGGARSPKSPPLKLAPATPGGTPKPSSVKTTPVTPNVVPFAKKKDFGKSGGAEHKKNSTPSNKPKHEKGKARKDQDRQGSKGMTQAPRKRPDGWKGPWPPKK